MQSPRHHTRQPRLLLAEPGHGRAGDDLRALSHAGVGVEHLRAEAETATRDEVEGFCVHLDATLARVGYYERRNGERLMRRMRTLFNRAGLLREEVDILRGFLKQVQRTADRADAASVPSEDRKA